MVGGLLSVCVCVCFTNFREKRKYLLILVNGCYVVACRQLMAVNLLLTKLTLPKTKFPNWTHLTCCQIIYLTSRGQK